MSEIEYYENKLRIVKETLDKTSDEEYREIWEATIEVTEEIIKKLKN